MAERIVSPGVFTRERDLSFLPAGIAAIGACIVGPTIKGPAFVPTIVSNFSEFEEMFGSTDQRYYTPYAVEQYLGVQEQLRLFVFLILVDIPLILFKLTLQVRQELEL